nr:Protein RIC-7, isoform a [Haemonchus contortus]
MNKYECKKRRGVVVSDTLSHTHELLLPFSQYDCIINSCHIVKMRLTIITRIVIPARASGVLFVAGVGSYCAYRICTKYLGKRFVWTLLESARFDNPATADRRLLYACGLPLSDDEDGEYDDCDDRRSRLSGCSRAASEMSLQRLSRYPRRSRGLLAIRQPKAAGVSGVLRRPSTSDRSSQSHPHSSSMSDRSASLRIVWEGQQDWDDEFAIADAQQRQSNGSRTRCSPPKVAPSTSVGDMSTVFDEVLSMSSAVEPPEVEEVLCAQAAESDDSNHEEILQRCLTDSKYMYESVIVANSEVGSDCDSVISTRSNLRELRKQLTRVMGPKGLWDLTQQKPSTSHLKLESNEMTDSGFSRSTRSKHSHEPRSLFDSAIGGELFSSEDESVDKPERHVLNPLRESDTTSQVSLEWCDEGLRDETCAIFDDGERFAVGDLELEYESNRESVASSSRSSPFNICHDHRPTDSRDLMVYACEKYLPYSPHFKAIQNFYHRRRLRRIAPSPRTADETLRLYITSALYHGYDLLKKSPSTLLEKAFYGAVAID